MLNQIQTFFCQNSAPTASNCNVFLKKMARVFGIFFTFVFLVFSQGCVTADKTDYFSAGNEFAKDGLYNEAIFNYQKVLSADPTNVHAMRNLGVIYVKIGLYKKASAILEKSIEKLSANYQANYYLAEAYRAQGRYDKAIYHYKNSIKIRPQDFASIKALAWSYYKIKYYPAAYSTIKSVASKDRSDPQAIIIRARILMKQNKIGPAKKLIRSLLSNSQPAYKPYARSILGDIFYEEGKKKTALKVYRDALKEKPYLAGALLGVGKIYNSFNQKDMAQKFLQRAINVRPSLTEAYLELAKALETTDPKKSLANYNRFIQNARNDPEFSSNVSFADRRIRILRSMNRMPQKSIGANSKRKDSPNNRRDTKKN